MKPVRIGGDFGNSQSTLAVPVGKRWRTLTIPSYLGSGRRSELDRMRRGGRRMKTASPATMAALDDEAPFGLALLDDSAPGQAQPIECVIRFKNVEQFAGDLAVRQSLDASSARGDNSRYWGGHTLRLLLTLAGLSWERRIPPLYLTTGLPVAVWSEENDEKVRRSLVGEHTFWLNGEERHCEIRGVFTMMEGAGALARLGGDEDVPQAVVDGGGGSLDLFYAEGQDPVIARCDGRSIGVDKIGDLLSEEVATTHGRPLTVKEKRSLLWAYARRQPLPTIYVDQRPVVLNGELREADEEVGRQADQFISETWASGDREKVAEEVARVFLIGGIAYFPQVRRHVEALVRKVTVSEQPEIENALGYGAVGLALTELDWADLA